MRRCAATSSRAPRRRRSPGALATRARAWRRWCATSAPGALSCSTLRGRVRAPSQRRTARGRWWWRCAQKGARSQRSGGRSRRPGRRCRERRSGRSLTSRGWAASRPRDGGAGCTGGSKDAPAARPRLAADRGALIRARRPVPVGARARRARPACPGGRGWLPRHQSASGGQLAAGAAGARTSRTSFTTPRSVCSAG